MEYENYYLLRLEVEGWISQFRSPPTITTQLSYLLPPKSTMIGFLLAKLGYMRSYREHWELHNIYKKLMEKIYVGVAFNYGPNEQIRKYIDYVLYREKDGKQKPTQIEYVVRPRYIFLYYLPEENIVIDNVSIDFTDRERVKNDEIFKTYLGINECPAIITKKEIFDIEPLGNNLNEIRINTRFAIPETYNGQESVSLYYTENSIPIIEKTQLLLTPPPLTDNLDQDSKYVTFYVPINSPITVNLPTRSLDIMKYSDNRKLIIFKDVRYVVEGDFGD